ncbi:MAG: ATP-binding protein [Burkholderiaceae bacterium]|nr:ATP-binding protein [Burkholderiaceae bacterium]
MTQMQAANEAGRFFLPKFVGGAHSQALFSLCGAVSNYEGNVILDAREVEFVDPLGIAVLGALLEPLNGKGVRIDWMSTGVAGYLERMNFFTRCEVTGVEVPNWARNDRRGSLLELTCVSDSSEVDAAAEKLATAITGEFSDADPDEPYDPDTGRNSFQSYSVPLRYSLSELLENSLTHARREGARDASVWVAAQYYKSRDMVRFSVVDNGCGFLATLRNHPALGGVQTHSAAVAAALKPRVSCNRDLGVHDEPINQGVGLTTTAMIAQAGGGGLTITSGDVHHNTQSNSRVMIDGAFWPGVAIAFTCKRQTLPDIRIRDLLPPTEMPKHTPRFG